MKDKYKNQELLIILRLMKIHAPLQLNSMIMKISFNNNNPPLTVIEIIYKNNNMKRSINLIAILVMWRV